jgi:hypothetical protein
MKGIIYTSLLDAENDLAICNTIPQEEPINIGGGIHHPQSSIPYTYISKKHNAEQWAIIADEKVELKLEKVAVELPNDWINPPKM